MAEEEIEQEKRKILFCLRGYDYIINPRNVLKIIKEQFVDENQNIIYTINIYEPFGEQTTVKFAEEEIRDKELLILISKFDEFGVDIK